MNSAPGILGSTATGISSNSWYSMQAFASDYYLGLNELSSETPVAVQLSDVEDATLWQFVAAGPDTAQGVYALRSKAGEAQFCLYDGCDGPEICIAPPVLRRCGDDAGQFQLYNSSSEGGGVIFVTYQSFGRSALSVAGSSAEGAAVEAIDLVLSDTDDDGGGYLWAIRSEEAVDVAAYPATFTPTYDTIGFSTTNIANATTPTSGSSIATAPSTTTQTGLVTTTSDVTPTEANNSANTNTGNMAVATATTETSIESSTASQTTEISSSASSPAQQTGSTAPRTRSSMKAAVLASLACLSLLTL